MKNSLVLICMICFFISCGPTKKLVEEQRDLPNISEGRLFKNISDNELEFNTLYAKKVDVSVKNKKQSNNLKAVVQIQKDSFIWVQITAPLGIEVARVFMTPDSIKFMNTREKEYMISDYSYFTEKFDVNLTFECFQKILTNSFFDFESCTSQVDRARKYKFDRDGNDYLLYTLEEKSLDRKIKKLYKKKRKNKEFSLILQNIKINPDNFRPNMVSIEDVDEKLGTSVTYSRFKDFEGYLYPERILFKLYSDTEDLQIQLNFNRLEFDINVSPNFRIPSKFKRVY